MPPPLQGCQQYPKDTYYHPHMKSGKRQDMAGSRRTVDSFQFLGQFSFLADCQCRNNCQHIAFQPPVPILLQQSLPQQQGTLLPRQHERRLQSLPMPFKSQSRTTDSLSKQVFSIIKSCQIHIRNRTGNGCVKADAVTALQRCPCRIENPIQQDFPPDRQPPLLSYTCIFRSLQPMRYCDFSPKSFTLQVRYSLNHSFINFRFLRPWIVNTALLV